MRTTKVNNDLAKQLEESRKALSDSRRKRIESIIQVGVKSGNRTFNNVDIDLLKTDYEHYQRNYKKNKNFGDFDIDKSGAIVVSRRSKGDDFLYIIDGNHRVEEAKSQGRDTIFAQICDGINVIDEARMFATQDVGKTQLKPKEKLKARMLYDPIVKDVMAITKKHSVSLDKTNGNRHLRGIGGFIRAFDRFGAEFCEWMFSLNESIDYQDISYVYGTEWIAAVELVYTKDKSLLNKREKNIKNVLKKVSFNELKKFVTTIPLESNRHKMDKVMMLIANGEINAQTIKLCNFDEITKQLTTREVKQFAVKVVDQMFSDESVK